MRPNHIPKKSPIGPKKPQNDPKNQKSKCLTKILQHENYLSIRVKTPKLFRPHFNPKHSPIEPEKAENDPHKPKTVKKSQKTCLLYTSDAADE